MQAQPIDVFHHVAIGYAIKCAIRKLDIAQVSFFQTLEVESSLALSTPQVFDDQMAQAGYVWAPCAFFVVEVGGHCGVRYLSDFDVPKIEILQLVYQR